MLSNVQLTKMANQRGIKLDYVGYKDTMPFLKPNRNFRMIINLDGESPDDFNKAGSHWVALAEKDGICTYFDPFGLPESIETKKFIDGLDLIHYGYSHVQIQDIKDDHCGWYCLAFLMHATKGSTDILDSLNDYVNKFDVVNPKRNLKILMNAYFL